MPDGLWPRRGLPRFERLLVKVAAIAVVMAGAWFLGWQLDNVIRVDGG